MTKINKIKPISEFELAKPTDYVFNHMNKRPDRASLLTRFIDRFPYLPEINIEHPAMHTDPAMHPQQQSRALISQTDRVFHRITREHAIIQDTKKKVLNWHQTIWRLNEQHEQREILAETMRRKAFFEKGQKLAWRQEVLLRASRFKDIETSEFIWKMAKEEADLQTAEHTRLNKLAAGSDTQGAPQIFSWRSPTWPEALREMLQKEAQFFLDSNDRLRLTEQMVAMHAFSNLAYNLPAPTYLAHKPAPITDEARPAFQNNVIKIKIDK